MHFILGPGAIEKFSHLRRIYERERGVSLDASPSLFTLPTMFGGTDVLARRNQIFFLEKIHAILEPFLVNDDVIETPQQWQAKLMGSRILVSACLYIQEGVGSSKEKSALFRLINEFLGVTALNFLDADDKASCYCTAFQLVNQPDVFMHLNVQLRRLGKIEFSSEEWELFSRFIAKEGNKKDLLVAPHNYFPVTTFLQPIFASAFTYVGTTIGGVAAGVVSGSPLALATQLQLSACIGGALIFMGPVAATGIGLLAPTIAAGLVSGFCVVSLSTISGRAMGFLGKGAGAMVGLPIDLTYNLINATGSLVVRYSTVASTFAPIDGIRLFDGVLMAKGNPVQFEVATQSQLISGPRILEITAAGEFMLDGKPLDDTEHEMAVALQELKSAITPSLPGDAPTHGLEEYCLVELPASKTPA